MAAGILSYVKCRRDSYSQTLKNSCVDDRVFGISLTQKKRLKNPGILAFFLCGCYTGTEEGLILKDT